jgi:hypothetical protein
MVCGEMIRWNKKKAQEIERKNQPQTKLTSCLNCPVCTINSKLVLDFTAITEHIINSLKFPKWNHIFYKEEEPTTMIYN